MFKKPLIFTITIYIIFVTTFAVEHRRCRKSKTGFCKRKFSSNSNETENLLDNHIPETICSAIPYPKFIINPYKTKNGDEILQPKNVSALSLRCGTCLAIGDKLQAVFAEVIDAVPTYDPVDLALILKNESEKACASSFKHYDLRRYKNDIIVTDKFPETTHISSEFDFKWPTILKKTCLHYVENINFLNWLDNLLIDAIEVAGELCSSKGLFRECKNLNYHDVVLSDRNEYTAMCTCSCASKDHT